VKNPRHIYPFSERADVQELFILFKKTEKRKIATWNAKMCARKLVYLYRLVQAYLEMQDCTRKRLTKDLYKNRDCMNERDKALHREVQTRLTRNKDEAYLRKLDDF
jgi:hypothetical protein